MNPITITTEFTYVPLPPFKVRLRQEGGMGRDGLCSWASATWEYEGRVHTIWLEFGQGEPFPYDLVRERFGATMTQIRGAEKEGQSL